MKEKPPHELFTWMGSWDKNALCPAHAYLMGRYMGHLTSALVITDWAFLST